MLFGGIYNMITTRTNCLKKKVASIKYSFTRFILPKWASHVFDINIPKPEPFFLSLFAFAQNDVYLLLFFKIKLPSLLDILVSARSIISTLFSSHQSIRRSIFVLLCLSPLILWQIILRLSKRVFSASV